MLRVALIILLGALVVFAVIFRSDLVWAFVWPQSENLEFSFNLAETHAPLEPIHRVYHPTINITGDANQPCQIELFRDGKLIARTTTFFEEVSRSRTETRTARPNRFEFPQVLLQSGQNHLILQAKSIRGGRTSDPYPEKHQTIEWLPLEGTRPVLYRLPRKVTTQQIHVEGAALPHGSVVLSVLGKEKPDSTLRRVARDVIVAANVWGHFEGDVTFPHPGKYFVVAHRSDDDSLPENFLQEMAVDFAPNTSSQIVLAVSYDQILVDIQDTRPKEDPATADLLSGHNSLAQFIDREFALTVNDSPIAFKFRDVVPQISINERQISIRAQAALSRSSIFPVGRGNLEISRDYNDYPLLGPDDTLEVTVNDYTTEAYTPSPNLIESDAAVWTGARDPVDWSHSVQVSLDFNPTKNPRDLFRMLTLSPYDLFDYNSASVVFFLTCLLYAIPFLWLHYLFYKHPRLPWIDPAYIKRVLRVSNFLLALVLLPGVQRVANALGSVVFERWGFALLSEIETDRGFRITSSSHPLNVSASTLAIWLVSMLLLTVAGVVTRNRGVQIWLRKIADAITYACLLHFCVLLFYWGFVIKDIGESFIPTVIVTLPVLALIALFIRRLASPTRPPAISFLYGLAAVIILALLAYPTGKSIFSLDSYQFSTWDVTRTNLNNFFSMIQNFVPYILLVGILQILRAATRRQDDIHPFLFDIAVLLFSCYVIGTTSTWFIIPIPFFLALILYSRVLAVPRKKVNALNYLKPLAIRRRRWFLDRVFDLSLSERLLSSIDQMEKKIGAGDVAVEEFLTRRQKLEKHADRVRQENDFFYELEAKDLALSLGPHRTNWLNGMHAVKRGLIISLPFLLLYVLTFLIKQIRLDSSFVVLWTILQLITFVLDWGIYAFFFGYFFNQLQGESGLKKGLRVALVVIACLSPVWLTSSLSAVELSATFLRAGQIFLFFTVLGVWAFDYHTFRNTLKEHFSWKRFAQFGDMPRFVAVASVLLTSAGVAFSSVLKGRFLEVVGQLVSAIFPEIRGVGGPN